MRAQVGCLLLVMIDAPGTVHSTEHKYFRYSWKLMNQVLGYRTQLWLPSLSIFPMITLDSCKNQRRVFLEFSLIIDDV